MSVVAYKMLKMGKYVDFYCREYREYPECGIEGAVLIA